MRDACACLFGVTVCMLKALKGLVACECFLGGLSNCVYFPLQCFVCKDPLCAGRFSGSVFNGGPCPFVMLMVVCEDASSASYATYFLR